MNSCEINESFISPKSHGNFLTRSAKRNQSLRKSLFGFNPTIKSTPVREAQSSAWMVATPLRNLSPIRMSPIAYEEVVDAEPEENFGEPIELSQIVYVHPTHKSSEQVNVEPEQNNVEQVESSQTNSQLSTSKAPSEEGKVVDQEHDYAEPVERYHKNSQPSTSKAPSEEGKGAEQEQDKVEPVERCYKNFQPSNSKAEEAYGVEHEQDRVEPVKRSQKNSQRAASKAPSEEVRGADQEHDKVEPVKRSQKNSQRAASKTPSEEGNGAEQEQDKVEPVKRSQKNSQRAASKTPSEEGNGAEQEQDKVEPVKRSKKNSQRAASKTPSEEGNGAEQEQDKVEPVKRSQKSSQRATSKAPSEEGNGAEQEQDKVEPVKRSQKNSQRAASKAPSEEVRGADQEHDKVEPVKRSKKNSQPAASKTPSEEGNGAEQEQDKVEPVKRSQKNSQRAASKAPSEEVRGADQEHDKVEPVKRSQKNSQRAASKAPSEEVRGADQEHDKVEPVKRSQKNSQRAASKAPSEEVRGADQEHDKVEPVKRSQKNSQQATSKQPSEKSKSIEPDSGDPMLPLIECPHVTVKVINSFCQVEAELYKEYSLNGKHKTRRQKRNMDSEARDSSQVASEALTNTQGSDQMDLEKSTVPRKPGSARKVHNRTDMNSIRMIETMVGVLNPVTPVIDKTLASKLRRCKETSDESDDEEPEDVQESIKRHKRKYNVKAKVKRISHSSASSKPSANNKKAISRAAQAADRASSTPEQLEIISDPQQLTANTVESVQVEDPSENSFAHVLPFDIVNSVRSLSKPNAGSTNLQENEKLPVKIKAPKKKSKACTVNSTTQSYLDLTKKHQKSGKINDTQVSKKRRNLYSVNHQDYSTDASLDVAPKQSSDARQNSSSDGSIQVSQEQASTSNGHDTASQSNSPSSNTEEADPQSDSPSSDSDEGFNSDSLSDSRSDILYDPIKMGCKRSGLRVRRLAKPFWINNAEKNLIGVKYVASTSKTAKAEISLKKKIVEAHKSLKTKLKSADMNGLIHLAPEDNMKIFEYLEKHQVKRPEPTHKKTNKQTSSNSKETKGSKVIAKKLPADVNEAPKRQQKKIRTQTATEVLEELSENTQDDRPKEAPKKQQKRLHCQTESEELGEPSEITQEDRGNRSKIRCVLNNTLPSLIESLRTGSVISQASAPSIQCQHFGELTTLKTCVNYFINIFFFLDVSNAANLKFQDCNNGVYFAPYITDRSDGIIKIIAGGHKRRARSKKSLLVSDYDFNKLFFNY